MKKIIYVCSPWRPTEKDADMKKAQGIKNRALARRACRMAAGRGTIPISTALFFTQFLNDDIPGERKLGMDLGLELIDACDELWVVTDGVISDGMMKEIERAAILDVPVRMFDSDWKENPHIQDLVRMLKEEAAAGHEDDNEDDFEDPCEGCDGCDEAGDDELTPKDEVIDVLLSAIIALLEDDATDDGNSGEDGEEDSADDSGSAFVTDRPHVEQITIRRIRRKERE